MKDRLYLIREAIKEATFTAKLLPKTRESSLLLTKLDEARLWAGEITIPDEEDLNHARD